MLSSGASSIRWRRRVPNLLHFRFEIFVEFSANFKAQGRTKEGSDLITPASAILKRKRGDAELTIFVKPDGGGSGVKMMTEGLGWDEK